MLPCPALPCPEPAAGDDAGQNRVFTRRVRYLLGLLHGNLAVASSMWSVNPPGRGERGHAGRMDVTTVNDRHLYRATVVVRDPHEPTGLVSMPDRIVRFGPTGWLTVVHRPADDENVALYPITQVLEVSELREVGTATPGHEARSQ